MKRRAAFTLFELILAIALSATLLALIGTAVNLYLLRVDAGRTRVEEAQLARSILATIAADLRAATTYQTQDISSAAQLAAAAADFDVDDLDQQGTFPGGGIGTPGTPGMSGTVGTTGSAATISSSGLSPSDAESTTTMTPGVNGLANELILDVTRLPRLDELFPAMPQQAITVATAANVARPSDLKTVRYFIRAGTAIDPSDSAATALAPASQEGVGGLVRQTIGAAIRQMAEQAANSQLLNSGQVLLAPEVTQIQFRYFDGTTVYDAWDMREQGTMPTAIEVRIWLDPAGAASPGTTAVTPATNEHMYVQTIDLPLAESAGSTAGSTATEDESMQQEDKGSGSDDDGGSTPFGNQTR